MDATAWTEGLLVILALVWELLLALYEFVFPADDNSRGHVWRAWVAGEYAALKETLAEGLAERRQTRENLSAHLDESEQLVNEHQRKLKAEYLSSREELKTIREECQSLRDEHQSLSDEYQSRMSLIQTNQEQISQERIKQHREDALETASKVALIRAGNDAFNKQFENLEQRVYRCEAVARSGSENKFLYNMEAPKTKGDGSGE